MEQLLLQKKLQRQELATKIFEEYVTKKTSIASICKKFGVEYLTFIHWTMIDEDIRSMLERARTAVKSSKVFSIEKSIHKIMIDKMKKGGLETETIKYKKDYSFKNPEGKWIESSKSTKIKPLTPKDYLNFINLFMQDITFAHQAADEFELLSVEEIENYIINLKLKHDKLKEKKSKR